MSDQRFEWKDVAHHYRGYSWPMDQMEIVMNETKEVRSVVYIGDFGIVRAMQKRVDGKRNWQKRIHYPIDYKPILRDLEDILPDFYDRTPSQEEEDAADALWKELWDIVFPGSTEPCNADVFEQKPDGTWMLRRGLQRIFLHESGRMYADKDGEGVEFNAAKVVHLLVSHGFDLFGLIESGQAIRKEAING